MNKAPSEESLQEEFADYFAYMASTVHKNAVAHGWWEGERNDGEILALIHAEVSETLEALRHGNPPDEKCPQLNSAVVELADIMIRCMDFAQARGWPLGDAIVAKHEYNKTRPYKHGKAF